MLYSFKDKPIILDGAMGTSIYALNNLNFKCPEELNLTNPEIITKIHSDFVEAGAMIIQTNTFGANREKLSNYGLQDKIMEINRQAVALGHRASKGKALIALSVGPTGKFVEPFGEQSFDMAYNIFQEQIESALESRPDLIIIETMSQLNEAKAAILAAKDSCSLPIFCTMTFEASGRTVIGTPPEVAVVTLQALGIDGVGVNCSSGPQSALDTVKAMVPYARIPIIAQPNGGIPTSHDFQALGPLEMVEWYKKLNQAGASILGGCCGTSPLHIKALSKVYAELKVPKNQDVQGTIATSNSKIVVMGEGRPPVIVGERINPTGKIHLQQSIKEGNLKEILKEAVGQQELGCHVLDVNVSIAGCDEVSLLKNTCIAIQNSTTLPLQFDTLNTSALEEALKVYSGRGIINSTTASDSSLKKIFSLAKRYGALVIGLTMDGDIPKIAGDRYNLAKKILDYGSSVGFSKQDVIIDPLITSAASSPSPYVALEAAQMIVDRLGCTVTGGISNVSYGLPSRESVNRAFTVLALSKGFSSLIINPFDKELMDIIWGSFTITSKGEGLDYYLNRFREGYNSKEFEADGLSWAIFMGNAQQALDSVKTYDKDISLIIKDEIIPVFNTLSSLYSEGKIFLPQLLSSSKAAMEVIDHLKRASPNTPMEGPILLASVEGDYHDIGKGISSLLLQANGFRVVDLGKGVSSSIIVDAINEHAVKLVGLSCLMTTTLKSLEDTVTIIKSSSPQVKIMAGGAVLTKEYCEGIGIDFYCFDGLDGVKAANNVFRKPR